MCFYYALTKKNPDALIERGVIKAEQLSLFDDFFLINGFEFPLLPVISSASPNEVSFYRWGLIPNNIKTSSQAAQFLKSYNTLNAKAETIHTSKIYSQLVLTNRCLVLCSGFFEWRHMKGKKIPYYISLRNNELFCFAGIWSQWTDELGCKNFTYSIITIQANELMAKIHNTKQRMPLIITPNNAKHWLDPTLDMSEIELLLNPIPSESMKAHTIKQFLPIDKNSTPNEDIIAYYNYPGVNLDSFDQMSLF